MKKKLILSSILLVLISITIYITTTNNKPKEELKVNKQKEINNSMGYYVEGEDGNFRFTKNIPTKEDGLFFDSKRSMCEGNTKISWNSTSWRAILKDIDSDNLKCYLYFRKATAKDQILENKNISERTDFSTILTTDTTGTIFKAQDNDGDTYYFAGATNENWVKFANLYWRIIRINGDGTVRLIYAGTGDTITDTNRIGTGTQIGTSKFNSIYNDNMYVGYMYESGKVQGLANSSTIKEVLEPWYKTNIVDKNFDLYVDVNAGFCGDRTSYTNTAGTTSGGGTGTELTYYGAYIRLVTNKTPTLKCNTGNSSPDLYTKKDASKGNTKLEQPVGLITADEVVYAGGVYGIENKNYYLYTGQYYWTLSPYSYPSTNVFNMNTAGDLDFDIVYLTFGVRPIINLRADTQFTGTGTSTDPYIPI